MNLANPVLHWAPELRRLAAGATIAAYLLVPPSAPAITRVQARPNGDAPWLITSIPDGYFDLRMARFRTREGLVLRWVAPTGEGDR